MIAPALIDQVYASSVSRGDPLTDFPETSIVCHVDTEAFSGISDFNTPISVREVLDQPSQNTAKKNQPDFPAIQEWTPQLEVKFRRLAETKAQNKLSLKGKVEFEKLMALRRQIKNPRKGEEVLAEYQQRVLTRNLVNALSQYVSFHRMPNRSR